MRQTRQCRHQRYRWLIDAQAHLDRGGLLLEQAHPCRRPCYGRLGQHRLLGLGQQVRPVPAQLLEVMPVGGQSGMGQHFEDMIILGRRPLHVDEHETCPHGTGPFVDSLHGGSPNRVGRVGGEREVRETVRPAHQIVQIGQPSHEASEIISTQRGQTSPEPLQFPRHRLGPVHQLGLGGRLAQEGGQIPRHVGCGEVAFGMCGRIRRRHGPRMPLGDRHRRPHRSVGYQGLAL